MSLPEELRVPELATMHKSADQIEIVPAANVNKGERKGVLFDFGTGNPGLDAHLEHIRNIDWASTSLGPIQSWRQDLVQLCHITLLDPQPRLLILGSDRVLFYNQEYSVMCGDKHPHILGQTVEDAWGNEAMHAITGPLTAAETSGRQVEIENSPLIYKRNGFLEEVYLSWTVISLIGPTQGFYVSLSDVTESLLAEKRRAAARALNAVWTAVKDPQELWRCIPPSFNVDPSMFPFAFLYSACPNPDPDSPIDVSPESAHQMQFELAGAVGEPEITSSLPARLSPDHLTLFSDLQGPILIRPEESPLPAWLLSTQNCIICPIRSNRSEKVIAFLYLGISPTRPYNDPYQQWINELTGSLRNAITSALLSEEEKRKQYNRALQAAKEQHILATALANRDKEAVALTDQFQRTLKVVNMADVGIFEYDLDGVLIYGNEAFCKMSRCPPEMMRTNKLAFLKLTYAEDESYILSKWNLVLTGVPVTFEMRFSGEDGQGTWVLAAVVPQLEDGVVKSVSGCTTNIHDTKLRETESVQRLQALERAKSWEQRFANFAEMAPIAIYFGSHSAHNLSYCNRAWFEMTGHPVVPFDQVNWEAMVHDDDIGVIRSNWKEVVTMQKAVSVQFRLKRRWIDGNGVTIGPVWVTASALPEFNEDGSMKGIIGTMLDISALKFAETVQQMKVREAVEAKRQQENFIDMTSHEIRNPLGAVVHCSDAVSETLSDMAELAKGLSLTTEHEIGNRFQELIANGVDSINTIISCSAHQKRIVDDILVLSKLDSNLLQIAPSAVEAVTLLRDIEKMFEAEAQRNSILLETKAHSSLRDLSVEWAMLDPGRVQQVLINLVTNALKFCKGRAERRVTVSIGASKERPSEDVLPDIDFAVAHSLHDSVYDAPEFVDDCFYLWFQVEDTGRGMTNEERGRIFARFCQGSPRTYNEYGGSGLGLFISRELSELQGGEIGVASELNVGSTFAFFIKTRHTETPAAAKRTELPILTREITDPPTPTSGQISVLVVEDNAVNQRVLKKRLTKHGYDVHVADDGLDALAFLQTTKHWRDPISTTATTFISVLLMDIEMPRMNGMQCTKRIRELEAQGKIAGHIPIIAVSANARAEPTAQALTAGMDDAISKPFRIADLVPKIERLAGWARGN